jgi:hypothetical protein
MPDPGPGVQKAPDPDHRVEGALFSFTSYEGGGVII